MTTEQQIDAARNAQKTSLALLGAFNFTGVELVAPPEIVAAYVTAKVAEQRLIELTRRLRREQSQAADSARFRATAEQREAQAEGERQDAKHIARAKEWLSAALSDGPVLHSAVLGDAGAQGLPMHCVYMAMRELGVLKAQKRGSGGRIRNGDPRYFGLPAHVRFASEFAEVSE